MRQLVKCQWNGWRAYTGRDGRYVAVPARDKLQPQPLELVDGMPVLTPTGGVIVDEGDDALAPEGCPEAWLDVSQLPGEWWG